MRAGDPASDASLRLDKWLWFARFFKTRALAQTAIAEGGIRLNGRKVERAAQAVRVGDRIELPAGRARLGVSVLALGARRGPAPEARRLYRELERWVPDPFAED